MKTKTTILVIALLVAQNIQAQTMFQKIYGDATIHEYGNSMQPTSDGGYIIAGETDDNFQNSDVVLVKTDGNGVMQWIKFYGDSVINWSETGNSVQQTADSGYIIAGERESSTGTLYDFYLIKTDASGNLSWSKTYGTLYQDRAWCVRQTTDGGYIIAGETDSTASIGNKAIYLIKTDANGNPVWQKIYEAPGSEDIAYFVQQTLDGGFILTGKFDMLGTLYMFLLKTDVNGNVSWSRAFGGTPSQGARGYHVMQTNDGGYMVTGDALGMGAGAWDVYVVKTDASGNPAWSKAFGGTNNDHGKFTSQTTDGGYIIAGTTFFNNPGGLDDHYLVKTDASGNVAWSKNYGQGQIDAPGAVYQTSDGGYVMGGYGRILTANFNTYLIKTDANGNSGCIEANFNTIATTPATFDSVSVFSETSFVTTVASPPTITTSIGQENTVCTNVGIEEQPDLYFSLYPNPVGNELIVRSSEFGDRELTIFNAVGESIYSAPLSFRRGIGVEVKVNISHLKSGIYFVRIRGENKERMGKFVKQ